MWANAATRSGRRAECARLRSARDSSCCWLRASTWLARTQEVEHAPEPVEHEHGDRVWPVEAEAAGKFQREASAHGAQVAVRSRGPAGGALGQSEAAAQMGAPRCCWGQQLCLLSIATALQRAGAVPPHILLCYKVFYRGGTLFFLQEVCETLLRSPRFSSLLSACALPPSPARSPHPSSAPTASRAWPPRPSTGERAPRAWAPPPTSRCAPSRATLPGPQQATAAMHHCTAPRLPGDGAPAAWRCDAVAVRCTRRHAAHLRVALRDRFCA